MASKVTSVPPAVSRKATIPERLEFARSVDGLGQPFGRLEGPAAEQTPHNGSTERACRQLALNRV
jgi:hypothetical protein